MSKLSDANRIKLFIVIDIYAQMCMMAECEIFKNIKLEKVTHASRIVRATFSVKLVSPKTCFKTSNVMTMI